MRRRRGRGRKWGWDDYRKLIGHRFLIKGRPRGAEEWTIYELAISEVNGRVELRIYTYAPNELRSPIVQCTEPPPPKPASELSKALSTDIWGEKDPEFAAELAAGLEAPFGGVSPPTLITPTTHPERNMLEVARPIQMPAAAGMGGMRSLHQQFGLKRWKGARSRRIHWRPRRFTGEDLARWIRERHVREYPRRNPDDLSPEARRLAHWGLDPEVDSENSRFLPEDIIDLRDRALRELELPLDQRPSRSEIRARIIAARQRYLGHQANLRLQDRDTRRKKRGVKRFQEEYRQRAIRELIERAEEEQEGEYERGSSLQDLISASELDPGDPFYSTPTMLREDERRNPRYSYRRNISADPMFDVWLARPLVPFTPTSWEDNPPRAKLLSLFGTYSLEDARGVAYGFNSAEIKKKLGLWALVVGEGRGSEGLEVTIKRKRRS